jgi:TPR repeat protein
MMYANGEGVIQDDVYAHMWYSIAASSGNNSGIFNRDSLAKKMTPAQLVKSTRPCP